MKTLFKIIISLHILLLSGHTQLRAYTYNDSNYASLEKNIESHYLNFTEMQDALGINIKTTIPGIQKVNDKIDSTDNEKEEDELTSSKKCLDLNNYFTAVFYTAQTPVYVHHYTEKSLPYCKHFSSFSSLKWYIIFRVIRL